MNEDTTGQGPHERIVGVLAEVRAYLAEEADFNRSWTDGRRGSKTPRPAYVQRRIELAEQREAWCAAIDAAEKELNS